MAYLGLLVSVMAPGVKAQTSGIPSPLQGCVYTLAGGSQAQCGNSKRPPARHSTEDTAIAAPSAHAIAPPAPSASSALHMHPPAPKPAAPAEHPRWELRIQDVTLAGAFSRWGAAAGWRLLWDVDKHLLIDSPDIYMGSFEQVVSAVLSSPGLANSQYPLEVCFYPNTPPLARITRRGDQSRDCK